MMKGTFDDDVEPLFKLPLTEFIAARKTLAAQLKKDGRANDAQRVMTLGKPSVSAWTVNQLYWEQREEFDRLLDAGQRFRKAQTSRQAGKIEEMRDALDERREALSNLSDQATELLQDAGHNPTLDMVRRITTTLEAVSAYEMLPDGLSPGRLTKDVDPPGFDSLASFMPGAGATKRGTEPARVSPTKKSATPAARKPLKSGPTREVNRIEETRQTRIAAAKLTIQEAKKTLAEARGRAEKLVAAQDRADSQAKEADKQRREAEQRFKRANAAAESANRRARTVADEVEAATKEVENAKRSVEKATSELERLFRQSP